MKQKYTTCVSNHNRNLTPPTNKVKLKSVPSIEVQCLDGWSTSLTGKMHHSPADTSQKELVSSVIANKYTSDYTNVFKIEIVVRNVFIRTWKLLKMVTYLLWVRPRFPKSWRKTMGPIIPHSGFFKVIWYFKIFLWKYRFTLLLGQCFTWIFQTVKCLNLCKTFFQICPVK